MAIDEENKEIKLEEKRQEWREKLKESDFDGHTDFQSMNFTQKLTWLSEAIEAVYRMTKDNPSAGCNRFFQPPTTPDHHNDTP